MCYGIAVTADTILSTVEISSTAIGAYIILLQEDSTYIIAAVVLMISFVATTFIRSISQSVERHTPRLFGLWSFLQIAIEHLKKALLIKNSCCKPIFLLRQWSVLCSNKLMACFPSVFTFFCLSLLSFMKRR